MQLNFISAYNFFFHPLRRRLFRYIYLYIFCAATLLLFLEVVISIYIRSVRVCGLHGAFIKCVADSQQPAIMAKQIAHRMNK